MAWLLSHLSSSTIFMGLKIKYNNYNRKCLSWSHVCGSGDFPYKSRTLSKQCDHLSSYMHIHILGGQLNCTGTHLTRTLNRKGTVGFLGHGSIQEIGRRSRRKRWCAQRPTDHDWHVAPAVDFWHLPAAPKEVNAVLLSCTVLSAPNDSDGLSILLLG